MIDEEFNVPPQNQFALPFSSPLPCLNMQAAQAAQAARQPGGLIQRSGKKLWIRHTNKCILGFTASDGFIFEKSF